MSSEQNSLAAFHQECNFSGLVLGDDGDCHFSSSQGTEGILKGGDGLFWEADRWGGWLVCDGVLRYWDEDDSEDPDFKVCSRVKLVTEAVH